MISVYFIEAIRSPAAAGARGGGREAVGRSADERSGRRVVGHTSTSFVIDGEQQVARLQQATGERKASRTS